MLQSEGSQLSVYVPVYKQFKQLCPSPSTAAPSPQKNRERSICDLPLIIVFRTM